MQQVRLVPSAGISLIKQFEKCLLRPYDDKQPDKVLFPGDKVLGVLTAGWGHTGPDVRLGMTVSQVLADSWLDHDLDEKVIMPLSHKLPQDIIDELTDNQYSALCSFVFNLGTGDPNKPEWTIWKRLRSKDFDQVPQEIAKFVNWNGEKSMGLVRRRAAEQVLWSTKEPGTVENNPPSAITRSQPTPPTPADPVPVVKSATIITGVAGVVTAAPPLISQAIQAVQPYAQHSRLLTQVLGVMSVTGALFAVSALVLSIAMKRTSRL